MNEQLCDQASLGALIRRVTAAVGEACADFERGPVRPGISREEFIARRAVAALTEPEPDREALPATATLDY